MKAAQCRKWTAMLSARLLARMLAMLSAKALPLGMKREAALRQTRAGKSKCYRIERCTE